MNLDEILRQFVESKWDVIAVPSANYLLDKTEVKPLVKALQQATIECGSCGCTFDVLYQRALMLLAGKKVRMAVKADGTDVELIYEDAKIKFAAEGYYQWKGSYPSLVDFEKDLLLNHVIVFDDGKILGVATIQVLPDKNYREINGKWLNDEPYVSIHRIATRREHYNKGVSTSLFTEVESYCLANNIQNIRIDTHEQNQDMRKLLLKLGFTECGIITLLDRGCQDNLRVAYHKVIS